VVSGTIAFEGNGCVKEYIGGYEDWLRQSQSSTATPTVPIDTPKKPVEKTKPATAKNQLTFKEKMELDALPQQIERLEAEKTILQKEIETPRFYQQDKNTVALTLKKFTDLEEKLKTLYARWDVLSS
jgi:ATP-binding cassette subfamily F protein uup